MAQQACEVCGNTDEPISQVVHINDGEKLIQNECQPCNKAASKREKERSTKLGREKFETRCH